MENNNEISSFKKKDLTGMKVNEYTLLETLGQGQFGTVYKAELEEFKEFKERYALKMIDINKNPKMVNENEYKLLKSLESPYLIRIIGEDFYFKDFYCFTMELCEGGSLKKKIKLKKPQTILNKLIASLKLKLESTNDFNSLIEEFKLNKTQLNVLDHILFENFVGNEEKAWEILKHSSFLDPEFIPNTKFISRSNIYIDLFSTDEDELATVKELLDKHSITEYKAKNVTYDTEQIFKWSKEIIKGLNYLYSRKIIHRDIKPDNILLTKENNAKLADVGISRLIKTDNENFLTTFVGTIPYMSPEIRKGRNYDYKTDIWSAGCVIYELISLEKFANFESKDKQLNTVIPRKLAELVKLMLVKDQKNRASSNELENLLGKLEKMTDNAKITYKELFYNQTLPPSRLLNHNKNFIGRKEYLKQIDSAFTKQNKQIVILSSFSGTGKSSIANEIGHILNDRSFNQFVYWMASDENKLDEKFRQFAIDLKVLTEEEKGKEPIEHIIEKIELKLRSNHMSEQILFILDNCDSIKNTTKYFDLILNDSAMKNIKFLITTTIGSPLNELDTIMDYIRNLVQHIIIEPFKKEESVSFMKLHLKEQIKDESELNEFIGLFDIQNERPLTLNKVIALIKLKLESNKDLKSFKEDLKSDRKKIDTLDNLFFESLRKENEKAWQILKYCSFLHPEFSPISIYTELFEIDEDEFFEAKEVLAKLSLITTEVDDEGIEYGLRIHRTLQNEAKKFLELNYEKEFNEIQVSHYEKVRKIFKNKKETKKWNKKLYYKNFKQITENLLKNKNLADEYKAIVCSEFAKYSNETDEKINSLAYYEKLVEIKRNILGTDENTLIADILMDIANVHAELFRKEKALFYCNKSLEIKRKILGNDDQLSIAETLNNIGNVYYELSMYKEALENYKKSLEISKKSFETDANAYVAKTLNNIANVYKDSDRPKEAIENYEKSLKIKTDEDPSTADIFYNIATVYKKQGRIKEALESYKKSYEIYKKNFRTDEHLNIFKTLNNIASVLYEQERNEEALEYYTIALEINKKISEEDDYFSIEITLDSIYLSNTFNSMASIYSKLGKQEEALAMYKKSLEVDRQICETDENSNIADTLKNIADLLKDLGRHEEAIKSYEKSLEIKIKMLDTEEDQSIANISIKIATVYKEQGKFEEALEYFKKSLAINQKISGRNDFLVAYDLNNISLVYIELKRYHDSFDNFQSSMEIYQNIFGESACSHLKKAYYHKIFSKIEHQHLFNKVESVDAFRICSGRYLFGICLSDINFCEADTKKTFFFCSLCGFDYFLCVLCVEELVNKKYFISSHEHSFREYYDLDGWACDGPNCKYESNNNRTKEKSRFKCTICSNFDLCSDCMKN